MTIEQKLDKRINGIAEITGEQPKELNITNEEGFKLVEENMKAKEQFLVIKNSEVYFRNVKLKIKE